ncbi:MAG TPA: LPS export ABC transporter periplasmic protein LptC [Gemmatimonadales bacterium]|nr:LPS export ABC transporter periplasmic protein LptC [Gemmatimonadales bacterium]
MTLGARGDVRAPGGGLAPGPTRLALLALALALAAAACDAGGARPTATVSASDTADQVIAGFSHYATTNGIRRTLLEADTALYFDATQTALLRHPRATFYDERGAESSTLTADELKYRWQDGSMVATGHVVLTTPDGKRLTTEALTYDKSADRISTDKPFVYVAGGDHVEGAAFTSDVAFKHIVTDRPRGTAGKELVVPGQE